MPDEKFSRDAVARTAAQIRTAHAKKGHNLTQAQAEAHVAHHLRQYDKKQES